MAHLSPPLETTTLPLPFLTFALPSLTLLSLNPAALSLFGTPSTSPPPDATHYFAPLLPSSPESSPQLPKNGPIDSPPALSGLDAEDEASGKAKNVVARLRKVLLELAATEDEAKKGSFWGIDSGASKILQYYTGTSRSERCAEVVVTAPTITTEGEVKAGGADGSISILFLRPWRRPPPPLSRSSTSTSSIPPALPPPPSTVVFSLASLNLGSPTITSPHSPSGSSSSTSLRSSSPALSSASGSSASIQAAQVQAETQLQTILEDFVAPKGSRRLGAKELETLMDHLPLICFTASAQGKVDFLNQQWFNYTGLESDGSFDLNNWTSLFHPDDLPAALAAFEKALTTGGMMKMEYRILSASGQWNWHVARGVPVRDPKTREIISWVAVLTEVEELVKVRSEALRIKEHVLAVLTGADLILLSTDIDLRITLLEGSLSSGFPLKGKSHVKKMGKSLKDVWPDEELWKAAERILKGEDDSLVVFTETSSIAKGSKGRTRHCFRYRLVPLRGGGGQSLNGVSGVIIVAADVTDRIEADDALERSNAERSRLQASELAAKEASRLKTEFVTNISHETRTPIAGMIGICELLLDEPTLAQAHRDLVEKCLRSGEILLDLVGMVLDLGKVEAGQLEIEKYPFKLRDVVTDAALFAIVAEKKGISFISDVGPLYEGELLGDRMRLRQILANGLSNAVKFTAEGGIKLKVRQEAETAYQVLVTIIIEDTGCGIDADILPTLFVPFRQADTSTARQYGGTGLGLAISRQLVGLMGGVVNLESVKGEGTKMIVHVPFDKLPEVEGKTEKGKRVVEVPETAMPVLRERKPENVNVLLAEDNALIREIVTKTLEKMKFNVSAVEDGNAAVQAVQTDSFDIILMDGQMPNLDGYQATGQIRKLSGPVSKIKIIALTASAIQGDEARCLEAGMDAYLAKPVRAKDLEAAIWRQLEKGPPPA
ncbi:histidine kinase [Pseudohyphozyma bogoriensis]|nr:histidine kinase [Pseudohyphozyma bogoriensis]